MSQLFALLIDAEHRKFRFRSAIVLYLAVLVFGSIPGARAEVGEVASGVVLHFVTYAGVAFLLFNGVNGTPALRALKTFLTVMAMGSIDEYVQSFFPYRHAGIEDWYVDVAAGLFVCTLMAAILWKKRRDFSAASSS